MICKDFNINKKEQQANLLIQMGILRLSSENSTYLIGELTREEKYRFNIMTNATDNFLKEVEKRLNHENKETLDLLTDALNDGIFNLKKELLK